MPLACARCEEYNGHAAPTAIAAAKATIAPDPLTLERRLDVGKRGRIRLVVCDVVGRKTRGFLVIVGDQLEGRERVPEERAERDVDHVIVQRAAAVLTPGRAAGFVTEIGG